MGQIVRVMAVILGINALVWAPIIIWARRKRGRIIEDMREALVTGEPNPLAPFPKKEGGKGELIIGPEPAMFSGSTGRYGKVKGDGVIALTDKRIVFRKLIGGPIDIPVEEISAISENVWFLGSYRGRRKHLILELSDGTQVGFMVREHDGWVRVLRGRVGLS